MRFRDRTHAGRELASALEDRKGEDGLLVLALPRGGAPVACEVAEALDAPLDVFLVRKLGVPGREELAFGAIASGGARVLNDDVVRALGISDATIDQVAAAEEKELRRRERAYRGDRPPPDVEGRAVVLVDDGLATGASMRAAVRAVREEGAGSVTVAAPVAAPDTVATMHEEADRVVAALTPPSFGAVGAWYERFEQTSDDEVVEILERARSATAADGKEGER